MKGIVKLEPQKPQTEYVEIRKGVFKIKKGNK